MPDIKLLQPDSLGDAVSLLSQHRDEAKIIAGGTALVIMLKNRLIAPGVLLSLDRVRDLRFIRHEAGTGLRIGALTTIREAEVSPVVREKNPTLARTFGEVGNIRVRNAATVGGNLSEADYASDPPCVLVAMRARVKASSARGEREIPVKELFRGFLRNGAGAGRDPDRAGGPRSTSVDLLRLPQVRFAFFRGPSLRGHGCRRGTGFRREL